VSPALAANPPENIPLGSEPSSCATESSLECEQWTVGRLNAAHKDLGLPAYALPSSFYGLSADRQLLVLADLDRVDYRITPIYGLNTNLTEAAQLGVREKGDPRPPSAGGPWQGFGSDWASTGALIAYYLWMYDDGYGSGNRDCTSPTASGCWGHRRVILGEAVSLPNPQLMGAATGTAARNAGSALIISSNGGTSSYYTWADAEKEGAGGEQPGGGEETGGEKPPPTQITVHLTITGHGTVLVDNKACTVSCTVTLPAGTTITLNADPAFGYTFAGWSGACSGTARKCTPSVVGSEVSATAAFAGHSPIRLADAATARAVS
jgi:hypothetical protein